MTLPAGWATVPVTGQYVDRAGNPPVGYVAFVSDQVVVVDGVVVVPKSLRFALDAAGSFSGALPATNDPDILPAEGWGYTVNEVFDGGRDPYPILVPYDSTGIDLATVTPAVPTTPVRAAYQLVVGTIATGAPGSDVVITLTDVVTGKQALNVTIPAGNQGIKGDQGDPATNLVQSVFGRIGAVMPAAGDYSFSQLANLPTTRAGYGITDAASTTQGGKADTALQPAILGVANGAATLGSDGKLTATQIPTALLGQVTYESTWDASAGTAPSDTPTKGQYWLVTTAGSANLDGITDWNVGDWAIYDGTAWGKCDNTDAIASWAGLTGVISVGSARTALGIDQVDNTSDADKPVSTAQQAALDDKADKSALGTAAAQPVSAFATASQGAKADSALQPTDRLRRKVVALGNISGDVAIDLSAGDTFTGTVTGDITDVTLSNLPGAGYEAEALLVLTQDATGGRTAAWPSAWKWPGGYAMVLGAAAGAEDHLALRVGSSAVAAYPVENMAVAS